jgi:hypothetical protein
VLWSPFYLVAHVAVLLARAAGSGLPADGFSWPYTAAAAFGSAFLGFAGLLLAHDTLTRHGGFSAQTAALSVAGVWLATPVLYYLTLAPAFSHACSLFAVSLLVWLWLRARAGGEAGKLADWALVGLAGGLCGLVREQDALYLAVPAAGLLWDAAAPARAEGLRHPRARDGVRSRPGVRAAALRLPRDQRPLRPFPPGHAQAGPPEPALLQVLLDPGHGLLVWAPLLLLAAVGLVLLVSRRHQVAACLAAGLLLQFWINGAVESWSQRRAFGSRASSRRHPCSRGASRGSCPSVATAAHGRRRGRAGRLRVVERLAHDPVRPEAHGPAAPLVAARRRQPVHRGAAAALPRGRPLLHRPRALVREGA